MTSSDAYIWPTDSWQIDEPSAAGMDAALLEKARDYALSGEGSGMITRGGVQVMAWGDLTRRYDLKSSTKSIGGTALGLALGDGLVSLDDSAAQHCPTIGNPPASNVETGWLDEITLRHLATHSAGFDKPGGCQPLLFPPGTRWAYSDGGTNWLADCLTLAFGRDLEEMLFERVFAPLGITSDDLMWRENAYRDPEIEGIRRIEFGAGVFSNVDALARLGLLYLRGGRWQSDQILPPSFTQAVGRPEPSLEGLTVTNDAQLRHGSAPDHYGLLWWNNGDATMPSVPRDAFWTWGLHESFIFVIPSLDIVASCAGTDWPGERSPTSYNIIEPFLNPVVESVRP